MQRAIFCLCMSLFSLLAGCTHVAWRCEFGCGPSLVANENVEIFRAPLLSDRTEAPADLYVYLLIESGAPVAKRVAALQSWTCKLTPAPDRLDAGHRLALAYAPFSAKWTEGAQVSAALRDGDYHALSNLYDDSRSRRLANIALGSANQTEDLNQIYLVEADHPLGAQADRMTIYALGGLNANDIPDWIVEEFHGIESGRTARTPQLLRAHPSWDAVLAGLGRHAGEFFDIVAVANAQTATGRCHDAI